MAGRRTAMNYDTQPSADRQRSYNGGYMAAGREGEKIVLDWLKCQPGIIECEDLRDLRPMQKADVDCSIYTTDGRVALVEIKSDRHLGGSGNLLFEYLRVNFTTGNSRYAVTLGWSARSPAEWLAFYAKAINEIWVISFDNYRKGAQRYVKELGAGARTKIVPTDNIKTTLAWLIPERFFFDEEKQCSWIKKYPAY